MARRISRAHSASGRWSACLVPMRRYGKLPCKKFPDCQAGTFPGARLRMYQDNYPIVEYSCQGVLTAVVRTPVVWTPAILVALRSLTYLPECGEPSPRFRGPRP